MSDYREGPSTSKIVGFMLLFIVMLLSLGWLSDANDLLKYKFFGPRNEAVRREVLQQSKAYKQGSVQRLGTLCTQVASTDDSHKGLINDVIAHEFVEWDMKDVPEHLRTCLADARKK